MNNLSENKYEKGTIGWLREQAKKDGFDNIRNWNKWKIQCNKDILAQKKGYKDYNEYRKYYKRDWQRKPENKEKKKNWYLNSTDFNRAECNCDCPDFLGVVVGEEKIGMNILSNMFEYIKYMGRGNSGYDFICKNPIQEFLYKYLQFKLERNVEYKIDVKTSRLKTEKFTFEIDYNKIANYFLLIGTNDEYIEDKIFCLYSWLFKSNDMVRYKSVVTPVSFNDRSYLVIPNKEKSMSYFKKWIIGDK